MALIYEVRDGVAIVTLNRPAAMNAIDVETRTELRQAWERVAQDDAVRCVLLTGSGEKAFCTGSDLKNATASQESFAELTFASKQPVHLLSGMDFDKPIICAINGYAIGGGLELALACDIRIASEHAQFALTEARIGSIPGAGGTQRLPRLIGQSDAMLMLLTGDRVSAVDALRMGLVSRVVPAADLLPQCMEVAQRVASNAPLSVRAIKRLVRQGLELPLDRAMQMESYVFGVLRDTEDRMEGRRAFQEKRPPVFKGR